MTVMFYMRRRRRIKRLIWVDSIGILCILVILLLRQLGWIGQSPASEAGAMQESFLRPEIDQAYIDFVATNEIRHGDRSKARIALTFDCGVDPDMVSTTLAMLYEQDAKATFFLEGQLVESTPAIVGQVLAAGHELGNHSYSHPNFFTIQPEQMVTELTRTEAAMAAAANQPLPMRYFRFPYGRRDQALINIVAGLGYQSVFWEIDSNGWRPGATPESVVQTVLNQAQNGGIVLMHCTAPADQAALPTLIPELKARGYTLETLSNTLAPEQLVRVQP